MFRRRRPLLRAAAVGGGAYMMGKSRARGQTEQAQQEAEQNQRISDLEQQPPPYQGAPPPAAAPAAAPAPSPMLDQLNQLAALHQQGVLTDDEFTAAKAKLFGTLAWSGTRVGWCPVSAQALPVCRCGHFRERSGQRGGDRVIQEASLAGEGRLTLGREGGFELVEHPAQAPHHLRRVRAVADDLGEGQHEQSLEVPQLPLDPYRTAGIYAQAGRIEPAARDGEEIADAIDGLYSCGRIIDGRG